MYAFGRPLLFSLSFLLPPQPQLGQVKNVAGYVGLNMPIAYSETNATTQTRVDSIKSGAPALQ